MEKSITLAVLGGTGKAGRYLVQALLRQGYSLRLLLRDPARLTFSDPRVEVVAGDARHYEAIRTVTEGCQAVLSTLGQPAGEPTIFSQATGNIVRVMEEEHLRRYILITGLNVDAPLDRKGARTQAATDWMKTHYPETTFDKQREYELLTESAVDWTLVRLPLIQLTDELTETHVSLTDCPGERISAASLAAFLASQLADTAYLRQAPFLANI